MKFVIDASVFFSEWIESGEYFTTSSVVDELIDQRSRWRFELFLARGLEVKEPSFTHKQKIGRAQVRSGDAGVLSASDVDILALAYELGATIVTDDFALQNVAHELGIQTVQVLQRAAQPRHWRYRCTGCGRYFNERKTCPVCGSAMKRTIK